MKKTLLFLIGGLATLPAVHAQKASRKAPRAQTTVAAQKAVPVAPAKMTDWPQLMKFHEVMSQTFHPAEEGKMEPIRERSGEMMARVRELIGTPFPEAYRTTDMKVLVANLENSVMAVDKLVKEKAPNHELMKQLTAAHDAFHNIVGLCRKSGEAHHD